MNLNPFSAPKPPAKRGIDPERFRRVVADIDARYDAMLRDAQTMEEVFRVEQERTAAHAQIRQAAFELSMGGFRRT